MLIKLFGIWVMTTHINMLEPRKDNRECGIYTNNAWEVLRVPCDKVAAEIKRQLKESSCD